MSMGQVYATADTGKRTYSVVEIQQILGIGRQKAYELCNSNTFRIIRVGRIIRVSKAAFDDWLDNNDQIGG